MRDLLVAVALIAVWLAPVAVSAAVLGPDATMTRVGTFFASAATVTFGGAYAILAYVGQQAVEVYGWLAPGEMLDGLGLAETTPGPLIQVVQFVGFLATYRDPILGSPMASAVLGSVLTTWVTFWPSFLFVLAGGPYVERIRQVRVLASGLRAVTCAVVGVIGNLAAWLSLHVLFPDARPEPLAIAIAAVAAVALLRFKAPMVPVLLASALVGLVAFAIRRVLG
jgi:chromate transporter